MAFNKNDELVTYIIQNSFSKITYRKIIQTFKNNLSILVIIPGILGGLWQIIELVTISPSLIRFFSISQILPDGLIILGLILMSILTALAAIALLILVFNIIPIRFLIIPNEEIKKMEIKASWIRSISYLVIVIFLFILSYFFFTNTAVKDYLSLIPYVIIMNLLGYLSIIFIRECLLFAPTKIKSTFRFGTILIPFIFFFYIWSFCREFKKIIIFPKNFINTERLIANLSVNNPEVDIEFLYMNDKYIFIKKTSKKNPNGSFEIEMINNSQLIEK